MDDLLHGPLDDRHLALGATHRRVRRLGDAGVVRRPGRSPSTPPSAPRSACSTSATSARRGHRAGRRGVRQPLLTDDLDRIGPGQAQYTLCCTDAGGVIDDLIAYYVGADEIFLVPNAANTAAVVAALRGRAPAGIDDHRPAPGLAVLAVQGPRSAEVLGGWAADRHGLHGATRTPTRTARRCGCAAPATPVSTATSCCPPWDAAARCGTRWSRRRAARRAAGGLGARDTLRTEMGYPLHGQDLSPDISPVQARCGWAVGWSKPAFWGRDALLAEKEAGPRGALRGLRAVGRGVPRPGMDGARRRHPVGRHHVGHVLSDTERRHRAGADRHRAGVDEATRSPSTCAAARCACEVVEAAVRAVARALRPVAD